MLIHNRTGFVVFGVLMMVVLIGAGCGGAEKPRASGETRNVPSDAASGDDSAADEVGSVPVGSAPIGYVSTDDGAITNWATYRSESLGIAIPYPEGWYVEEQSDGKAIDVYRSAPPRFSDAPSEYWVEVVAGDRATALRQFSVVRETSETDRLGVPLLGVPYPYDAADPEERLMFAYLWGTQERTYMIGGPQGSATLEAATDRLVEATR